MKNPIVLDSKWVDLYTEHIIVLKNPTQLSFSFYDFSVIYYDFFKTVLGGNLIDFEKFRGWYRLFHRVGDYVVHPS